MVADRRTAETWQGLYQDSVLGRTPDLEVGYGPLFDGVIVPVSEILDVQNKDVRDIAELIALVNESDHTDTDIDRAVFNELIVRSDGDRAVGTARFFIVQTPSLDITVPRGYPVGTVPDDTTGQAVVFVTTEARTLTAATASSYFNASTARYELDVPILAASAGSAGIVGPARIKRFMRASPGFDGVTNPVSTSGGADRETNTRLVERYFLSVTGRQLSTPKGRVRWVLTEFPGIRDSLVVRGVDPLLARAGTTANAVDVFLIGQSLVTVTEATQPFTGAGQVVAIGLPPLVSVSSVSIGGNSYDVTTDYDVVFDSTGVGASTRAADGIRFVAGYAPTANSGDLVTITYTYNALVRAVQAAGDDDDVKSDATDVLYRAATAVDVYLNSRLRVLAGFSTSVVQLAVQAAVDTFINTTLGLGDGVEASDLQGEVRKISGVDDWIIDRLTRTSTSQVVEEPVAIGRNEYPTIQAINRIVTLIT